LDRTVWTVRDRGPWTVWDRGPSGFGPDRPGPDRLQYSIFTSISNGPR
jgi:hypothetical protein